MCTGARFPSVSLLHLNRFNRNEMQMEQGAARCSVVALQRPSKVQQWDRVDTEITPKWLFWSLSISPDLK